VDRGYDNLAFACQGNSPHGFTQHKFIELVFSIVSRGSDVPQAGALNTRVGTDDPQGAGDVARFGMQTNHMREAGIYLEHRFVA